MVLGNYYLDRECLSPPEELQREIFPLIEPTDAANEANGPDLQDIAQRSFTELLRWFRVIILQDAVFLREKFSGSPLWNHHIFKLPQFEDFASRLKVEARYGDVPQMVRVNQAIPDIAHILREHHHDTQTTLNIHHQSTEHRLISLDAKVQQSINQTQPLHQLAAALSGNGLDVLTNIRISQAGEVDVRPMAAGSTQGMPAITDPPAVPAAPVVPATVPLAPLQVPRYHMQTWVHTVVQLWEEYDRGVVPSIGEPRGLSIRALDEQYDSRWRREDATKKFYGRRKFIWQEVIAASEDLRIPPGQVAERMDRWRLVDQKPSISLRKLNDMLSTIAKARAAPLWGPHHANLRSA